MIKFCVASRAAVLGLFFPKFNINVKEKGKEKEALRFTICNFLTSNIFGNLALYDFIALHLSSPTLTLTMDMVFFLPSTCSLPPSATGRLKFPLGRFNGNI